MGFVGVMALVGRAETRGCGAWRGGLFVAARPNAAPFTSGRVRRLQQGHALRVVYLLCQSECCSFPVVLEVQPGPGLDKEVRALIVAIKYG